MDPIQLAVEERFLSFVNKTDECWIWTGCTMRVGYGQFSIDKRSHRAHRVAYKLWVGEIPDGSVVHHTCSVRNCVNPAHLQIVTPAENTAEMLERQFYVTRIKELEEQVEELENKIRSLEDVSE